MTNTLVVGKEKEVGFYWDPQDRKIPERLLRKEIMASYYSRGDILIGL